MYNFKNREKLDVIKLDLKENQCKLKKANPSLCKLKGPKLIQFVSTVCNLVNPALTGSTFA